MGRWSIFLFNQRDQKGKKQSSSDIFKVREESFDFFTVIKNYEGNKAYELAGLKPPF